MARRASARAGKQPAATSTASNAAPQKNATPSGSRSTATIDLTNSNPPSESDNDDAEASFSAPEDDDDSDDDDFAQQTGGRGKRKRAAPSKVSKSAKSSKAAANAATAGKKPPRKKAKAKAKESALILNLSNLSEVTFDIVHEIFSYLNPLDLLNIAHSNKANKEFLYSPECKSIWKAARRNFPGLPECPADMTEPQYAYLAFGKECFDCGKGAPKKSYTIWTGRTRLCTTCVNRSYEHAYVYGRPRYSCYEEVQPLLEFLPTIKLTNGMTYSCRSTANKWTCRYYRHDGIEAWIKPLVAKWSVINEHAKVCEVWEKQRLDAVDETKKNAFDARVDAILDRLEPMGWQAEVRDIKTVDKPERRKTFSQHALIQKICQKDLTERIFQNQSAALVAYMQDYRTHMHLRTRLELLKARIPHLHAAIKAYAATVAPNEVAPSVGDFFTHKDVRDFVVNTARIAGPADLAPLRARLPALGQELAMRLKKKLLGMVAATAGEFAADPAVALALATTAFRCTDCTRHDPLHAGVLRHPRVLAHHHAVNVRYCEPAQDRDMEVLREVTGVVPWNRTGVVRFDVCAAGALRSVVELCGLDPKTTTKKKMDELDPIVECLKCNSARKGRMVMRWEVVPRHLSVDHKYSTQLGGMRIVILEGEDAETIRARLDEEEELVRAAANYDGMACARCFKHGNTASIKQHLMKEHGVAKSDVKDDMVVRVDSNSVQKQFYAWPPRKEVKLEEGKLIMKTGED